MAEAIASSIIPKENVLSAGTYSGSFDEPESLILKELSSKFSGYESFDIFLEFMKEKGFDIGNNKTKKVTKEMIEWADIVVDMAEEPYDLEILKKSEKVIKWDLPNDTRKTKENFTKEIENIKNLLNKLTLSIN